MAPYRTIFCADLVQDSAMSVGGTLDLESMVDTAFCRDGLGRPTLRGEGLGGALVATARRLSNPLPQFVSCGAGVGETTPSRWLPHTTHPDGQPRMEVRRHVGIRQDTGARADGVLFDVETTPRGTQWPLMVEVDTFPRDGADDGAVAERLAAEVLLEWRRGRCWLGAHVARGLGWAHLENLRAYRLDTDQATAWPDNRCPPANALADLSERPIVADDFKANFEITSRRSDWIYVDLSGTLFVGEADDGYGVDPIAVGGQEDREFATTAVDHFLAPESLGADAFAASLNPAVLFATTRNPQTEMAEPVLPGSGIRGPWRHALSRWLRAEASDLNAIRDPNVQRRARDTPDLAETLFGTTEKSAALLVCDAHLEPFTDWHAACVYHHAENEFTGGVYASSLHSRAVLTSAQFRWRMVLEYRQEPEIDRAVGKYLSAVLKLGRVGHLPMGGAKWRVAGWPRWHVDKILWGTAGEDPLPDVITELADLA